MLSNDTLPARGAQLPMTTTGPWPLHIRLLVAVARLLRSIARGINRLADALETLARVKAVLLPTSAPRGFDVIPFVELRVIQGQAAPDLYITRDPVGRPLSHVVVATKAVDTGGTA